MRKHLLTAAYLALASCAGTKPLPQCSEAQKLAQCESLTFWQIEPAKRSTSSLKVKPGSHMNLICSIFESHPPVVQVEVEAASDLLKLVKVERQSVLLRRLVRVKQKDVAYRSAGNIPHKCKGCTFNLVAGNQIVAGKKATIAAGDGAAGMVAGKKAGPMVLADSGARIDIATTKKGQTAAGEGIAQKQPTPGFTWRQVAVAAAGCYLGCKKFIA